MIAARRVARLGRPIGHALAAAALASLAACSRAPPPSAPPAAGAWLEFQGSWVASGTRHTIGLGGDRRASVVDLSGSMLLTGASSPGAGFRAQAIALGDTATGVVGRAVWTDEKGDQAYSEFSGDGTATGARIAGTFVGGTGRYAGATGTYAFTWQYVLEAEDGTVQGRAVGLAGRVRFGPPPVSATQEAK
jgi:hypothetical protein